MKNVMKKIAAAAMAFTLLGAGTVITNTVAPQATLTASAACQYHRADNTYCNRIDYIPVGGSKVKVCEYHYCRCCGSFYGTRIHYIYTR